MEQAIQSRSFQVTDPSGRNIRCLKDDQAIEIAEDFQCTVRRVYLEALRRGVHPYRYLRNRAILSGEEQLKLLQATVAVVGAGGLGGFVIEMLARLGIGHLILADHDTFEETNLNRQVLSSKDTLGMSKTEAGALRVEAINPAVDTTVHRTKINEDNGKKLLSGAHVIVDALDGIPDRLALGKTARALNIPMVHGAVAGFEGHVMTIFPEDSGLVLIYGEKNIMVPGEHNAEAILGVPAVTPALIATLQAMEVMKIILRRGDPLRNRMLHVDLEACRFSEFSFPEGPKK